MSRKITSLTLIIMIFLISRAAVAWGGSEKKARKMYNQALLFLGKYEPLKAEKLLREIVSEHMDTSVATEAIRTLQKMKYSRTIEKYGNVQAKAALRNLITAMGEYYKDHRKYANSINELEEYDIWDDGTTVTIISADGITYAAKAFHEKGDKIYLMKGGEEEIEGLQPTSLKVALLGTTQPSGAIHEIDKDYYRAKIKIFSSEEEVFQEIHQQNAVAVIEEIEKKKHGIYRVGDSVQGAIVKKILRGKVILRVKDRDEILTIEEGAASRAEKEYPESKPFKKSSTITVDRSDLQEPLGNIHQLLSQVRIRPHFRDGRADGLAITNIRAGSFFEKLELRDGDIVQRIDGRNIDSPDDLLEMHNKLKSGSHVALQIMRDGEQRIINYKASDRK